nr:hypothetical protein CFP56_75418 [Quercus suber]
MILILTSLFLRFTVYGFSSLGIGKGREWLKIAHIPCVQTDGRTERLGNMVWDMMIGGYAHNAVGSYSINPLFGLFENARM